MYNIWNSSWNTFLLLKNSVGRRHPESILLGNSCQPLAMNGNSDETNTMTSESSQNPPASIGDTGDVGSIPGSGRSPGGGNGHPLQYSCLENPMDRRVWGHSPWGHKELDMTDTHF